MGDEEKKGRRRPGNYGAGKGATQKLVRLEDPYLSFVEGFPGGLKGIVEAAYHRKLKPR